MFDGQNRSREAAAEISGCPRRVGMQTLKGKEQSLKGQNKFVEEQGKSRNPVEIHPKLAQDRTEFWA